jgi:hypothetical protein
MNRGAALVEALLVSIATPATWPLALATFLLRGGILLFIFPIAVLPTTVGLGNTLGPTVTSIAFGSVSVEEIGLALALIAASVVVLVSIAWLASGLEGEGIRVVATDADVAAQDVGVLAPVGGRLAGRVLAVRMIAHLPFAIVLAVGFVRLVGVTYAELTSPVDVDTPVAIRVLAGAPEVIVAIVLTWMIGQIVGAIGARAVVLRREGVGEAIWTGVKLSLGHPLAVLARFWVPTVVLAMVIVPSAMAANAALRAATAALQDPVDPVAILATVLIMVALWATGLLLTSVVCAWRSATWTVALTMGERTFGGSEGSRPGDWRAEHPSAKV